MRDDEGRPGAGSDRDIAENIAVAVKSDIPGDLQRLRRFIEDDALFVEIATRALRGEGPGG